MRGFDPQAARFTYVVNERFGNTSAGATAIRAPFQLAINLSDAIGYDARTLQIQSLGRGNSAPANAKTLVDSFLVRFNRQNAATAALQRADSLALTPAQVAQLQIVADSSATYMKPHIDSLVGEVDNVQKARTSADVVPLLTRIRTFNATAAREQRSVDERVHKILTDVQWALLPEFVRNPLNNLVGGGGGAAGRGGGGGRRGGPGGGR